MRFVYEAASVMALVLLMTFCHTGDTKNAQPMEPLTRTEEEALVHNGQDTLVETDELTSVNKTDMLNIQTLMIGKERYYIRSGQTSTGTILYNIEGNYIREGQSSTGRILYNIDGNWIRETQSSTGRILYNIDGNYIREGQSSVNRILYNIDGHWIRETQSSTGRIVCNISKY